MTKKDEGEPRVHIEGSVEFGVGKRHGCVGKRKGNLGEAMIGEIVWLGVWGVRAIILPLPSRRPWGIGWVSGLGLVA